ncbi:hypothetical protein FJ970_22225 [Mesorhizobium sp. B2-1-8]|uniref:hypothetical protein n=1 Tax=Mesorhizobium sp. B2-1-8 TaxID=2589967 RepID=UPI00112A9392|nr:hypothetical protein [Mesorhizobium sp. B2-1-8]UCI17805.1 hypothetical protein FJ970_22225 [Mesorhizobium sp. B2-1-8]
MDWLAGLGRRLWRSGEARPARPVGFPIAILSFDRPGYLREVLYSLRPQIAERDRVVLFQDGGWNRWSGRQKGNAELIAQCVAAFRRIIPWGEVVEAPENLGIALNYERAERYLFEDSRAEKALFLEDDLLLSPNYLGVVGQLLDLAEQDQRIAYVAAYGDLWAGRRSQRRRAHDLIPMHENWGAALTRSAWLAERPFRKQYLELVGDCDYSRRDHEAIKAFYSGRGWKNEITSQDAARWIACAERGAVRVTTFACHARYIGMHGEHSTPKLFKASKFDKTVVFRGTPPDLTAPTDDEVALWLGTERQRFQGGGKPFYVGHGL